MIKSQYLYGPNLNASVIIKICKALKNGIECLVRFECLHFDNVVPYFKQNVTTFRHRHRSYFKTVVNIGELALMSNKKSKGS